MKPRDEWGPADELANMILGCFFAIGVITILVLLYFAGSWLLEILL